MIPRWQQTAANLLTWFKFEPLDDDTYNTIDAMFRDQHPGNYRLHWVDYSFTVDFDNEEDKLFWLLKNS
jgi:hypothetical protein